MYSIASSALRSPGEVHLTVALVDAGLDSDRRVGACSHHLATRREDDTLRVFVEPNPNFRLPSDATDIIMVGPGTGVAPFRAFLQEREERGATGRNWLFFGERRLSTSFLYQTEWLDARKRGTLHRLDVAFSRDQAHKIYVQDRMREAGRDLWGALSGGAHLYVCGDARHMAKDVEQALLDVARQHGHLSPEGAEDWLVDLRAARRYARDVY